MIPRWAPYAIGAAILVALVAFGYARGRDDAASQQAVKDLKGAVKTTQAQADVNATDAALHAQTAERQIIIIRETANAVEDIERTPLGPAGVVGIDDLRALRDRNQRLRDDNAARRQRFLDPGEDPAAVREDRPAR